MGLRLGVGSFVNNDTVTRCDRRLQAQTESVRTADCGRRSAVIVGSARGLTANGLFSFRGRDVAVTVNSVKILHAVRSAITAIAELLVKITVTTEHVAKFGDDRPRDLRDLKTKKIKRIETSAVKYNGVC